MMKKIKLIALVFLILLASCSTDSDESDDDNFDASVVCPAEGTNAYGMPNRGTFVDERDGQEYKYTTIGDQVWMAENLRYIAPNSMCYDDNPGNCEIYGRLYSLNKDGNPDASIDENTMKTLCPKGWSLPTQADWENVIKNIGEGNDEYVANRLKSSLYWSRGENNEETNICDFSALPTGVCWGLGNCSNITVNTSFWTSTVHSSSLVQSMALVSSGFSIGYSNKTLAIRCIKD